jgi:hypothetical protein
MEPGDEWLTKRELRLRLLGPVEITPEEQFSDAELAALYERTKEHQERQHE